ncbi:glycoside hydrolase N-terminal domain-containing protein [Neobacillus drentensis]|uniref:glycosyl hydrolase family 95 catalytic domain-containing protein n=1 Tax=Neobacillus drentensis TaxID=220684 RepID=UPI001F1687A5|nr:glycoside hydrolase N-terminal domain-containing protein [Neobacillus drentensis]ULT57632.1 glycoside hydrolase N-terminal domain-containing protein [Neobacillus drentensis]
MINIAQNVPLRGAINRSYAKTWENAMVSGNGRQGVMVFGDPSDETIIGTHCRLYLPQGNNDTLPHMAPYLPTVRKIIQKEGYQKAIKFFYEKSIDLGYRGLQMSDPSHPGFQLHIHSPLKVIRDYYRMENFETGEIVVSFVDEQNIHHERKTFVSRYDNVIVHTVTNGENRVSCLLEVEDYGQPLIDHHRDIQKNFIFLNNLYLKGDGKGYRAGIRILAPNGKVKVADGNIQVENADSLTLLMKIVPFQGEAEFSSETLRNDLNTIDDSYKGLLIKHKAIHTEIFNRVSLNLADDQDRMRSIEDLVQEAKETNTIPLALLEKMYDAGRYVFICSSCELSPNLQGIWSGDFHPAWSGDYTFDTNVQLSIASALSCNMMEGLHGFIRMVKEFLPGFRENAASYYGCRGIMASCHSSTTGRHFHWNEEWPLILWTCGAGWLGHWFYQYYQYTGDKKFLLEETIPYLRECALFYEDFLIEDSNGTYRFTPSYSAENGCGDNATQDIAVAKEVLTNLISAHKELGLESDEISKWETMLSKLPPYLVNKEGAIQEWSTPGKEENYNHRHFSHLYPIFQSNEFSSSSNPVLWNASKMALEKRLEAWLRNKEGDTSSTHGRMHAALCATKFGMSQLVYEILQMMVVNDSMYPTMVTSHYNNQNVFNVDGNGAIPQIINEMLIYSNNDSQITLLGALPEQFSKGTLKGLLLPKQLLVKELKWDTEKREIMLEIESAIKQQVTIQSPIFPNLKITHDRNCKVVSSLDSICIELKPKEAADLLLTI